MNYNLYDWLPITYYTKTYNLQHVMYYLLFVLYFVLSITSRYHIPSAGVPLA